ncbi:macrolide transport system ATP-binding/permease protein [Bacillus fengqiuensis]|nr:macrolide transport system ATP-binding/permease protein [Bacillus fengqiuensis]
MWKKEKSNTSNRKRMCEVNGMNILRVRNLEKNFGERTVLRDLTFDIQSQDRIGLVGLNGAGKTTLANIIYGKTAPDKGTVENGKQPLRVGYLLQSVDYQVNGYVEEDVSSDFLELASEFGLKKVHSWEHERFSHLSEGEKLKMTLAHIWASNPDILILDEPTNHLDFQGVQWLIEQIHQYKGTVILISHDRYFLDQTITKIFELEDGKLTIYDGNYSAYRTEKKKRYEDQLHQYETQQKHKARIESQVANLQQWAGKAHRTMREQEGMKEFHGVRAKKIDRAVKSKMKRLDMELEKHKVEKPKEEKKVRFQFDASGKRGKRIIEAKKLTKKFRSRTLFQDSHFYMGHGERIGLIGANGAGKTTFINMLLGKEPLTGGELWKSESLKIAYLSQDVGDMPSTKSPIEALGLTHEEDIFRARTILANMGMKENVLNRPIQTLSLGERTRVKLTEILIREHDFLILDEPTNHLDLPSREQFEETLAEFSGTMLIVSHDYYFLNRLCDKLLIIEDGMIKRVEMNLEQYKAIKNQPAVPNKQDKEERLLLLETEISAVIGELSLLTPGSDKYSELDAKFLALSKEKRELSAND